jgi:hypothetical protein
MRGNRNRRVEAHSLAHWLEWQTAKRCSEASRGKHSPEWFYDPLAATCLGELIYDEFFQAPKRPAHQL